MKLHADCYSGLEDAVNGSVEDNAQRLGKQIILASTFIVVLDICDSSIKMQWPSVGISGNQISS